MPDLKDFLTKLAEKVNKPILAFGILMAGSVGSGVMMQAARARIISGK